jgi:hypothetical protein
MNDPVPPPPDYDIPMVCHDTSEFDVAADLGLTCPPAVRQVRKPGVLGPTAEPKAEEPEETDQPPEQDKKSA